MRPIRSDNPDELFTAFVRTYRPSLRRVAYLLCGDFHEADDLVQTALLAVHLAWASLASHPHPFGYARRVLVNAFISERRRLRWQREESWAVPPQREPAAEDFTRIDDLDLLLRALRSLGPRQRAVIVLRLYEDLSIAQTAEILGCDAGTVRSQASRALAAMRSILGVPERPRSMRGAHHGQPDHQRGAAPSTAAVQGRSSAGTPTDGR